jgi:hypothetical protein
MCSVIKIMTPTAPATASTKATTDRALGQADHCARCLCASPVPVPFNMQTLENPWRSRTLEISRQIASLKDASAAKWASGEQSLFVEICIASPQSQAVPSSSWSSLFCSVAIWKNLHFEMHNILVRACLANTSANM